MGGGLWGVGWWGMFGKECVWEASQQGGRGSAELPSGDKITTATMEDKALSCQINHRR